VSSANDTAFAAALPRFVAIWRQVAAAFAGAPASLSFEVANEPVAPLSLASLNAMYAAVLPVVRAQHPTRTVYIGGLSWMSPDWIAKNPDAIVFPKLASGAIDTNIALEVHAYDPYAFCLQSPPTQSTWGTPADVAAVQSQYDGAAAWGAAHGRRVYFGEAGCALSAPSRAGRVKWYSTIGGAARTSGVEALTVWDDDGSFKLYDRAARTWDAELLAALFGRA
jgi:endoglucanase